MSRIRVFDLGAPVFMAVLLTIGTVSTAHAQSPQPDQGYTPTTPEAGLGIRSLAFYRGQSFTAGESGWLTRVGLFVNSCSASNDADVVVRLRAGTSPTAPVLGEAVIPAASIPYVNGCGSGTGPTAAMVEGDLTSAAFIRAGDVYTIWAHSADESDEYGWWGDATSAYPRGSASVNGFDMSFDVGFRTYVLAPPNDQSYLPAVPDQGIGIQSLAFYRGQSFTAGQSGWLTHVSLFLNSCSPANDAAIIVRLRAGTSPSSAVLAEGTIPAAAIPYVAGCGAGTGTSAVLVDAILNAAAVIVAGEVYSIWAHSADQVDEYGWWGDPSDAYSGGTALTNSFQFGFDLGFTTSVMAQAIDQSYAPAVPEQGLGIRDLTFYRGQSFTADQSGWLTHVSLFMNSCSAGNDSPVIVRLRAGTAPGNVILGEAAIAPGAIPLTGGCGAGSGTSAAFVNAFLNRAALVSVGQVYTIWAHSADETDEYGWWGDSNNAYPGGAACTGGGCPFSFDLGFKTYVWPLPPNTSPGSDVSVDVEVALPGGGSATVGLTFDEVVTGGDTTVNAQSSGPPPPSGFKLTNPPVYYDITTAAVFAGVVRVCLNWVEGQISDETRASLFHYENGNWVDITDPVSRDTVNNQVCGTTTSLSPFALMEIKYAFSGFFQPVDNPPTVNAVKAGSGVPVKFSLGSNMGLDIFAPGYPRAQLIQCVSGELIDVIEETASAGNSGLSYDVVTGRYTYVWKTQSMWANSCRELQVKFKDGETYTVRFTMRK